MSNVPTHFDLPPIMFEAAGPTPELQQQTLQVVFDSPGYPSMCMMLVDLILRRADVGLFDFTAQAVAIKYQIDGIWHPMPPMDRQSGDILLATMKHLAGMNYEERRLRQDGSFKALFENIKYKFRLVSQGVPTGERVGVYVDFKRPPMESLEDLGIRSGMKSELVPLLHSDQGLAICTAMPGEGYTSLWRAFLGACDRFTRDYYVVEEKSRVEPEVINVFSVYFDEKKSETAFSGIRQLMLKQPEVVAFAELPNGQMVNQIFDLIEKEEVMSMSRLQGKNAVDGLLRLVALKPDVRKLATHLKCVLAMRVLRKLCTNCRMPFVPDANLSSSLGIPPGRVKQFYRAMPYRHQVDERGNVIPPCQICMGTGFVGRVGLFELLKMSDPVRKALVGPDPVTAIPAAVKSDGHISMREEAILLVARGLTSLEEIQRVMSK